jgi:N-acetylglucosaminyl-diphospho-decaprenol L-rhamnosyltransferase
MSSTDRTSVSVKAAIGQSAYSVPGHADCGIIVVSYNSAPYVEKLLDSLPAATTGLKVRCVVLDNNSSDETVSIVRARNDAMIIESRQNLGYAGAINRVRDLIGSCSSLLILNPDMILEPGAVVRLHEALDQPGVGISVPMLLTNEGKLYLSTRREPSVARALGEAFFGDRWAGRPAWLSETIRDRLAYQHPRDVAWAGGAALLISAACNETVGDWDDGRFFLYSEEIDYAARARRCGFRIRYVPTARARHMGGGSGRSPALGALMAVNRVRYFEKYHNRPVTSLFRAAAALHYLLRSADPDHRVALRAVIRRSRWHDLPGRDAVDGPNRSR